MLGSVSNTSRLFLLSVVAMVIMFFLVVGGVTLFLTNAQNDMAQRNTEKLVNTAVKNQRSDLELYTIDYSMWDEGLANTAARNIDWIYPNMASTVETGAFQSFSVIYDNGDVLSWLDETADEIRPAYLSTQDIEVLRAAKAKVATNESSSLYRQVGGEIWVLSTLHSQPYRPGEAPIDVSGNPLLVFGQRVDEAFLTEVENTFLIDGVELQYDTANLPADRSIPLPGADGAAVVAVTWPLPAPGTAVLKQWQMPAMILALAVLGIAYALGRLIVMMAVRLKSALEQAREADRAKSVLLANVSHELRTPMNGIIGAAELLTDAEIADEDRELVDIIESSAKEQIDLIEELLQIARIDAGDVFTHPAPVAMDDFSASATALHRMTANQKGLDFNLEVDPSCPVVMIDGKLLRQSITNLLGNAIKFTTDGTVGMRVIWNETSMSDGALQVEVWDTGIGIDPEDISVIFERFKQVDERIEREYGGSGLGLSITKSLVESMGGALSVTSESGKGSTFMIVLPCDVAKDGAATPELKHAA